MMVTKTREFTYRQIIDAMERNGYRKASGSWVTFKDSDREKGEVYSACAMGQALLNLGVRPKDVVAASYSIGIGLKHAVIGQNDSQHLPIKQIAQNIREQFANDLDHTVSFDGIYFKDTNG